MVIDGEDCAAACIIAISADVPSGSVFFLGDGKLRNVPVMLARDKPVGVRRN
jgi:hypothetical protein